MMTRIDVAREEWIKNSDTVKVGQVIKGVAIKNKTAPPQRVASVPFYFADHGHHSKGSYDTVRQVYSIAVDQDIIEQKGAWYNFGPSTSGKERSRCSPHSRLIHCSFTTSKMTRHTVFGEPLDVPKHRGA